MNEQKLSSKAMEVKREYAKQWRAKNRDKVKEANRKYWERKAQQMKSGESEDGNGTLAENI